MSFHFWNVGSSPHPRGTLKLLNSMVLPVGIIPASAGNTFRDFRIPKQRRDHPRIRGEHPAANSCTSPLQGSSPHPRGTLKKNFPVVVGAGIIPASAGNTALLPLPPAFSGDHPRIRGEHTFALTSAFLAAWIIPASAGNTKIE